MDTSPLKNLLVGRLMPEKCYEELFVRLHLHGPCLKFVLNKIVGFWIILDTFLAQFPQLLKLLWRGSAEGLSLTAFLLQLYALSCPVVYAAANNFPFFLIYIKLCSRTIASFNLLFISMLQHLDGSFVNTCFINTTVNGSAAVSWVSWVVVHFLNISLIRVCLPVCLRFLFELLHSAWAERLFTLAQTATIVFLILHYRGETLKGFLLLLGFGGVILLLVSFAAVAVIRLVYTSTLAAFILSKVVQIVTNYQDGHTGQLSGLSALLSCIGALGAAIVSVQESGGSFTTLSHILSTCLSFVLMAQIVCYKRSTGSAAKKTD